MVYVATIIAGLALLATFYQLYLQRRHNEKSLKPLCQIKFVDQKSQLAVQIENCGMGVMIIESLSFLKEGKIFSKIDQCLDLNPKSYFSASIDSEVKKVLSPNSQMDVFAKNISMSTSEETDAIRRELALIRVQVNYQDIYKNKFAIERGLEWFSRHSN